MIAATMKIEGKVRRIEEREDGLWYMANAEDQVELGSEGKPYYDWYERSDFVKNFPQPCRLSGHLPKVSGPYS